MQPCHLLNVCEPWEIGIGHPSHCAPQVLENEYLRAMRSSNFSPDIPVYVASGLLSYGAIDGESRGCGALALCAGSLIAGHASCLHQPNLCPFLRQPAPALRSTAERDQTTKGSRVV